MENKESPDLASRRRRTRSLTKNKESSDLASRHRRTRSLTNNRESSDLASRRRRTRSLTTSAEKTPVKQKSKSTDNINLVEPRSRNTPEEIRPPVIFNPAVIFPQFSPDYSTPIANKASFLYCSECIDSDSDDGLLNPAFKLSLETMKRLNKVKKVLVFDE